MSEIDESNDKPVLREELAELERRINQRIDDRASAHDRTTQAHVDGLNNRIDDLSKSVDAKIDDLSKSVDAKIDGLSKNVDAKIDGLNNKIDGLSKSADARYDVVNEKFKGVYERLDVVDEKFKGVHERIDKLEDTVQKQSDYFQSKFDRVLDALEKMDSKFTSQIQDLRKELSAGLTAQRTDNDNRQKNRITLLGIVLVLLATVVIGVGGWITYALSVAL